MYDAVVAHGRRSQRGQGIDNSPIIVNYENFFVSLRDLANSMMPGGLLSNTVAELGLESIMLRIEKKKKKAVMPLRVAVKTQKTQKLNACCLFSLPGFLNLTEKISYFFHVAPDTTTGHGLEEQVCDEAFLQIRCAP